MFAYILKRILLMVPTLLGVLLLAPMVIQFVPGGPVEQYLAEAKAGAGAGAEGGGMAYRGAPWIRSVSSRSKPCTALTSLRTSVFSKCWGSLRVLTLGQSFFQNKPVWALIAEKLPVSISLGLWTFFHQLPGGRAVGRGQGGARRLAL